MKAFLSWVWASVVLLSASPAFAQLAEVGEAVPPARRDVVGFSLAGGGLGVADRSGYGDAPWGVADYRVAAYQLSYRHALRRGFVGVRALGYHGRLHAIDEPSYQLYGGDVIERFGLFVASIDYGIDWRYGGGDASFSVGAIRMQSSYVDADPVFAGSVRAWAGRLDVLAAEVKIGSRDALVTDRIGAGIGVRGDYGRVAFRAGIGIGYATGPGLFPDVEPDRRRSGRQVRSHGGSLFFYVGEAMAYAEFAFRPSENGRITIHANFGQQRPILRLGYEHAFDRGTIRSGRRP